MIESEQCVFIGYTTARAKEALREAVKCDPASDTDCRTRRRGGMGIRG